MKYLIRLILLVLFGQIAVAQTSVEELKKVTDAFMKVENLSMNVVVTAYATKNDKNGSLVGEGLMKRSGPNYYSLYGTDEMITNNDLTLIIDHDEKSITYFEQEKHSSKKNMSHLPDIDSLISLNDSVVYEGEQEGLKHFCFYDQSSYIVKTDVYIDNASHFIKKIVYYYADSNEEESIDMYKVMIEYKNIKLDKIDQSAFSGKKYVTVKNGKPILNTNYKQYKLIFAEKEEL